MRIRDSGLGRNHPEFLATVDIAPLRLELRKSASEHPDADPQVLMWEDGEIAEQDDGITNISEH